MKAELRAAQSRLCENGDFKAWLYATLDDLCLFARDEGMLTDFGQGIRAAANRIKNRLLESAEGVDALCEMARKDFNLTHEAFREAEKKAKDGKRTENKRRLK